MKLIFRHCGNMESNIVPFKYESKEKFLFDFYESKLDVLFDIHLDVYDIRDIEKSVFTLEEWFDKYKESVPFGSPSENNELEFDDIKLSRKDLSDIVDLAQTVEDVSVPGHKESSHELLKKIKSTYEQMCESFVLKKVIQNNLQRNGFTQEEIIHYITRKFA